MGLEVKRVDVWAASIEDQPGGLAVKLGALADAGASLAFVMARRAPEQPKTGVVFVSPLKGAKQLRVARKLGFVKTKSLNSVRVEGRDKRGMGAIVTAALASKGINLRGLSAAVIGRKFVLHLALDSPDDAAKAARALRALK